MIAPEQSRVVLRPRGLLETLDLATAFVRTEWRLFLRFTGLWLGLPWLLCIVLSVAGASSAWLLVGALLFLPLLDAPLTLLAGRLLFAPTVALSEVTRDAAARMPRWASLMARRWVVAAGVGVLTFGLGLPLALAWGWFVPEVAFLEQSAGTQGWRRVSSLCKRDLASVVIAYGISWLIVGWCVVAGEFFYQAAVRDVLLLGEPFGSLGDGQSTPGAWAGLFASRPFVVVYRLFVYVDVRTRSEGWDLQVAFRAAGMRP